MSFSSFRRRFGYHKDASYALALFLTFAGGLFLASFTVPAFASGPANEQQASDQAASQMAQYCNKILVAPGGGTFNPNQGCPTHGITITAIVPPLRATTAPVITTPTNAQSFNTNPNTVAGTCPVPPPPPKGTAEAYLIKVFSNGILVGSVICSASGKFSVPVDFVIGQNELTAVAFNTLDQPGPTSNTVTVTLNQPAGGLGFSSELILQSVNYYRGIYPGQTITWPITIVGGQAPYAVSVDWGDGTTQLITRLSPGPFTVSHVYKGYGTGYLGTFPLIIRATDSIGHTAYLQLTTLVNPDTGANSGTGSGSGSGSASKSPLTELIIIWPLWIVLLLMIISFWLGERREKHVMRKQLEALA